MRKRQKKKNTWIKRRVPKRWRRLRDCGPARAYLRKLECRRMIESCGDIRLLDDPGPYVNAQRARWMSQVFTGTEMP